MRTLLIIRGCMGSGKTTYIKNNNLVDYTISADDIRLLYHSPRMTDDGVLVIT